MLGDIRALRAFAKQASFACAVVVTLAPGIAVNTLVFSQLNSPVLRLMPVRDASRIVRISPRDVAGRTSNLFSHSDFLDYRAPVLRLDPLAVLRVE